MKKSLEMTVMLLILGLAIAQHAHCQSFLTNGLVAYFPFKNGSGKDESGNGNNASVVGATPFTDRFGLAEGAMRFGMSGLSVVVVPKIQALDFNQDFTICLWARHDQPFYGLPPEALISCGQGNSNLYLRAWGERNGTDGFSFGWGPWPDGIGVNLPEGSLSRGWWQVAVVRSAQTVSIYWEGLPLASAAMGATSAWNEMWLGRNQDGSIPLTGQMDDVRLYNRALSAEEIRQLYELEGPPFAGVDKMIHLYATDLLPGTNYQLQVSSDLSRWADLGPPFTATSSSTNTFFEVADGVTFWRLKMLSDQGSSASAPKLSLGKAAKLSFAHLAAGTAYQLQYSWATQYTYPTAHWIDYGPPVTATESTMVYPEYVDIPEWGRPLFQLKAKP